MIARVFLAFLFLLCAGSASAIEADEILPDAALEARAVAVGAQLRCVVCKMQSINDSPAPLARDLRLLVRQKITDGMNDDAVIGFVRARYGDYVLLEPPVQPNTWALWLGPLIILAAGGGLALAYVRRRAKAGA